MHGGNEHEGETDENPGHPVENVDIGHNTVAKLRKRLILRCLGTDVLLNLRLLLLDNLAAIDVHSVLGVVTCEQIRHFLLVGSLALRVLHLG